MDIPICIYICIFKIHLLKKNMKKHCFLSKWILFESACLLQQPKITKKRSKKCSTQSTPTHTSSFSQILFTRVQKKPSFEIYKKKTEKKKIYTKYIVLNGCCLMFYIFLLLL